MIQMAIPEKHLGYQVLNEPSYAEIFLQAFK